MSLSGKKDLRSRSVVVMIYGWNIAAHFSPRPTDNIRRGENMSAAPFFITARDLVARGKDIPAEMISSRHLIYSSPATLAFNSPGAQGFGVKRAGLAVPGSVMLLVAPGCCGRNTSALGDEGCYGSRMFCLEMEEADIITGRHLKKIPEAAKEVCDFLPKPPSALMLCITCVDALLGSDMERVCKKTELACGVPVRPCYMYALTREGIKPPMAAVRQSIYSLLSPAEKDPRAVNILGFFTPLDYGCELRELLRAAGVRHIREIGGCRTFSEYKRMSEANFNLILDSEARLAAYDMENKLGIPSVELTRFYRLDKIANQYNILGKVLGTSFNDSLYMKKAVEAVERLKSEHPKIVFSIGETINADPFELALALTIYGFKVAEIFGTVTPEEFHFINPLSELSPGTKIYSNLSPSMLFYDESTVSADVTLGRDAAWYRPSLPNVPWNSELQPFGYSGLVNLIDRICAALNRSEMGGTQ